jgi:hypothetical protein
MHMVIREYTGPGATALFDLLATRTDEVESLMRGIDGLISYTIAKTLTGGIAVTICRDQAGIDESTRLAKNWITMHAADIAVTPPTISAAQALLHVAA